MLQKITSGPPQKESVPGGAPPFSRKEPQEKNQGFRVLQGSGTEQLEQPLSPGKPPLETPLAESSPLQQRRHMRPLWVTLLGAAARSFAERSARCSANPGHLLTIAIESTLSLLAAGVYTKDFLPDMAHQMYKKESAVEYAYTTTKISRQSAGEKAEIDPFYFF